MFFHSSNGQHKNLNEKDCRILVEIPTRDGFGPMYRVRFDDKKQTQLVVYADELKGKLDYASDEEREAYIAKRDNKDGDE